MPAIESLQLRILRTVTVSAIWRGSWPLRARLGTLSDDSHLGNPSASAVSLLFVKDHGREVIREPRGAETAEYELAVVDKGGYIRPDDPVVAEFASAPAVLQKQCFKTRSQIGDYTVSIQKQLIERGVQESLLAILKAVTDPVTFRKLRKGVDRDVRAGSILTSSQTGDCAAYMTEYVLLRTEAPTARGRCPSRPKSASRSSFLLNDDGRLVRGSQGGR
jgi:hypothetical protein